MQDVTVKDEVFQRLDALGEKLGVAATQLWEVLVQQHAIVNGVFFSLVGVAFLVLAVIASVLFFRAMRAGDENAKVGKDCYDKPTSLWRDADVTKVVVCAIAAVACLAAGIGVTLANVPHFINPQYYALQDILKVF